MKLGLHSRPSSQLESLVLLPSELAAALHLGREVAQAELDLERWLLTGVVHAAEATTRPGS